VAGSGLSWEELAVWRGVKGGDDDVRGVRDVLRKLCEAVLGEPRETAHDGRGRGSAEKTGASGGRRGRGTSRDAEVDAANRSLKKSQG
jgi:hypothetical protein